VVAIADTSALLAFFNIDDPDHEGVARAIARETTAPVVSPYVIAELDYLMTRWWGVERELLAIEELVSGAYDLAEIDRGDLTRSAQVVDRYRDQAIGITDASIVVLADRYRTRTVLTLDRRHFDVLRPLSGGRFSVLP
jgi:predicted nucleic acid-binding protein